MKSLDDKYVYMTETPVRKLVLKLAVPTMVSMMVTALYNVVDAAFVGHLSTEATAGIGIAFAYMTFIQAMGFFFGHGSGNHISRALGAKQYDDAGKMAAVGFFTPMIIGTVTAVAGLCFLEPLARLMGAPGEVVAPTVGYLRYIVAATPFMMTALTLNNQLRLQGNARFAMVGIGSGAVLNMLLDPLFIFALEWGVEGASAATAVSQLFSWVLLLMGTRRSDGVKIKFSNFKPTLSCYYEILRGGLPSLCRQFFNMAAALTLNYAAASYAAPGCEASTVGAFAIVTRTTMFAFALVLGFDQGFQPVCGFNYGAHKFLRVREAYTFTLKVTTVALVVIAVVGYIFARQIVMVFRDEDPVLIEIGTRALRWQWVAFPLIGLGTATNMLFQNIRMTIKSTLLSIGRQGIFFLPAIAILPRIWGLGGLEATQATADACTFLLAVPYAIWIYRKLGRMAENEKKESSSDSVD